MDREKLIWNGLVVLAIGLLISLVGVFIHKYVMVVGIIIMGVGAASIFTGLEKPLD